MLRRSASKSVPPPLEARRRGGVKSGETRRRKRDRGWQDWWLDDLEEIAREVRATGNGAAKVRMTELALATKRENLAQREAALVERERELGRRATKVSELEENLPRWDEWVAMTERESKRIEAEVAALEQARDELRAIVEREADAAGFDVIDEEVAGDAAPAA